MEGWIKAHRNIQQHYLWQEKPFSKGQAWIDLILLANHKDNKFILGNEVIEVERGSFVTSEIKLMDRWGWSKSKVRAFLQLLQNDSMLVKKTDRKKTTLKIVNYDVWQDSETTKEPQKDHKRTTKEPQKDTNKNDKNDKNDKKKSYGEYQHVKLTNKEFETLVSEIGLDNLNYMIKKVDEYVETNRRNKPYTNYNLVIRNWMKKESFKKKEAKKSTSKPIKREDESWWEDLLDGKIP